jgi:hypothetical protein
VSALDDFGEQLERVARELVERQETVHERVACPRRQAAAGERCRKVRRDGTPSQSVVKHPHRERLRADGIYER